MIEPNIEELLHKAIDQNILVYDSHDTRNEITKRLLNLIYTTYKKNYNSDGSKIKRIYVHDDDQLIYDYTSGKQQIRCEVIYCPDIKKIYHDDKGAVLAPGDKGLILVEFVDGGCLVGSY